MATLVRSPADGCGSARDSHRRAGDRVASAQTPSPWNPPAALSIFGSDQVRAAVDARRVDERKPGRFQTEYERARICAQLEVIPNTEYDVTARRQGFTGCSRSGTASPTASCPMPITGRHFSRRDSRTVVPVRSRFSLAVGGPGHGNPLPAPLVADRGPDTRRRSGSVLAFFVGNDFQDEALDRRRVSQGQPTGCLSSATASD